MPYKEITPASQAYHNHDGTYSGVNHDHSVTPVDHGDLTGLSDDDHTQYLTVARHDADDHSGLTAVQQCLSYSVPGPVVAHTGEFRWYAPFDLTIVRVDAMLGTVSSSGSVDVDVNRNGTTIFTTQTNRPIISASNFRDESGTPNVTAMTQGSHYLTVDVDADGTNAENLLILIIYTVN